MCRKSVFLFSFFTLLLSLSLSASNIKIALYNESKITSLMVTSEMGRYTLITSDSLHPLLLDNTTLLQITVVNDSIQVNTFEKKIGTYTFLKIISDSSLLKLKAIQPALKEKICRGNFDINILKGSLNVINTLSVEDYVAGVVEAEVGSKLPAEFYKAQCIITRTYALSHLRRHEAEKFNLCDKVHCQAYNGVGKRNPFIVIAAQQTKDVVLVDSSSELITAAFFSNCGGTTANSEDVWNKKLSYLRSVNDTFCLKQRNAVWKKEIDKTEWLNYIKKNCKATFSDSILCNVVQANRAVYFIDKSTGIKNTSIRLDLNLKSAFFTVSDMGDKVLLTGRGYGHGVGLCQEGAIQMARKGYSYTNILHFYFQQVNIINLSQKEFFKG